jgi:hypothetical protein
MTKESAAWLVLRVIGLLLLGQTLYLLFAASVHVMTAEKMGSITGTLAEQAERQAVRAWVDTGMAVAQAILSGALSFYFLRKGKVLHKLLMKEAE